MMQDRIGREGNKRILNPNSAHTRPGGENSEKNSKKNQKIREQLFGIIFSQIGMRRAEKERKELQTPIPLILDPGEKISEKNSKTIQKIKKQHFVVIFSQNGTRQDKIGRESNKRILDPNSDRTLPEGPNSEKKSQKNSKN